jgi:hypothetical protein
LEQEFDPGRKTKRIARTRAAHEMSINCDREETKKKPRSRAAFWK